MRFARPDPHGTVNRYTQGCRCPECKAASSTYRLRMRRGQQAMAAKDPAVIPHGTTNGYSNYRCRCDECKAVWNADRRRRYHEAKSRGAAS